MNACPSQDPLASSKAPNQDLMDMVFLCTLKINIENQNLENMCIKDLWPYQTKLNPPHPNWNESNQSYQINSRGFFETIIAELSLFAVSCQKDLKFNWVGFFSNTDMPMGPCWGHVETKLGPLVYNATISFLLLARND